LDSKPPRYSKAGERRDDAAITRLVGAILLEQNDEWAVQRARYMTRKTMTKMLEPPAIHLPAVAG
jgi:putative transposase